MMLIILYFALTLVVLYTEAMDCHIHKDEFKKKQSLIYALMWPIGLPVNIYRVYKAQQKGNK